MFDWNGSPLAKLDLNRFITSFDIDVANGSIHLIRIRMSYENMILAIFERYFRVVIYNEGF